MELHVLPQGAGVSVALITSSDLTHVRFVAGMYVRVFLSVAAVGKPPAAASKLTFKGLFTCMRSLVDLEIFRTSKHFLAAMKRAGKGLLSCVNSDMVHELVFGFERLPVPRTVLPMAHILRVLWSTDVLHGHMGHELIHAAEGSGAVHFPCPLVAVGPLAQQFVFDILFGAPEESIACPALDCHVQGLIEPQKLCDKLLAVALGAQALAVGVCTREDVSR